MLAERNSSPSLARFSSVVWRPIFNPLYDYCPSQDQLARLSYKQLKCLQNFRISRQQCGSVQFTAPVDLTNVNFMSEVRIGPGEVAIYPEQECEAPGSKKLNQPAQIALEFPRGSPQFIEEIELRIKDEANLQFLRVEGSTVFFKVKQWCHYRIFEGGSGPPSKSKPRFKQFGSYIPETRGYEEQLSDYSQESRPPLVRAPAPPQSDLNQFREIAEIPEEPEKLHEIEQQEEKTGLPPVEEESEEEPDFSYIPEDAQRLFREKGGEQSQNEMMFTEEQSEEFKRRKRVLQSIVSILWGEFKSSSDQILHHFDQLSISRLPESRGQHAPPQYYDPTQYQCITNFLNFFEKVNHLLQSRSIKDGAITYSQEIRLLSLLSVLKKGVYLQGEEAERTIQESMIVRNHLLEWLRIYSKIDRNMEELTMREKIAAATFLEDLPWLMSLSKECEDGGINTLSKIIRSIIKKKSYMQFPERQKQEYIEKLLNVNDTGIDIHEALRLVLFKDEIHLSNSDWKLKLFYDLVHNPSTANEDTLRAVLPLEPVSRNHEEALIYYHFTESNQKPFYLDQIMSHSVHLDPLLRLMLLYYLEFEEHQSNKGTAEQSQKIHEYLEKAFIETLDELQAYQLVKESFLVSFLMLPIGMNPRLDTIIDLIHGCKSPEKLRLIFKLFGSRSDSIFLYYLQGEHSLVQGDYQLAMSSFMKSRHVMKSYRVFIDCILYDFVSIFPWERLRMPNQEEDLSEDEIRSLIEMKGRVNECSKLKHHFLRDWEVEGSKYQQFFSIAVSIAVDVMKVTQCKKLHTRITQLNMDPGVSQVRGLVRQTFQRLGGVLARWRREISIYNSCLLEENPLCKGLYQDDELDSFNLV